MTRQEIINNFTQTLERILASDIKDIHALKSNKQLYNDFLAGMYLFITECVAKSYSVKSVILYAASYDSSKTAEDIISEAFYHLFKRLSKGKAKGTIRIDYMLRSIHTPDEFKGLLYHTTRNYVLDMYKHNYKTSYTRDIPWDNASNSEEEFSVADQYKDPSVDIESSFISSDSTRRLVLDIVSSLKKGDERLTYLYALVYGNGICHTKQLLASLRNSIHDTYINTCLDFIREYECLVSLNDLIKDMDYSRIDRLLMRFPNDLDARNALSRSFCRAKQNIGSDKFCSKHLK